MRRAENLLRKRCDSGCKSTWLPSSTCWKWHWGNTWNKICWHWLLTFSGKFLQVPWKSNFWVPWRDPGDRPNSPQNPTTFQPTWFAFWRSLTFAMCHILPRFAGPLSTATVPRAGHKPANCPATGHHWAPAASYAHGAWWGWCPHPSTKGPWPQRLRCRSSAPPEVAKKQMAPFFQ